ncbi:MAG: hypothetical protein AAF563_15330 [Pseudomonadota bacterium]
MSKGKVAVLHSGLLARKGEARPMAVFAAPPPAAPETVAPEMASSPTPAAPTAEVYPQVAKSGHSSDTMEPQPGISSSGIKLPPELERNGKKSKSGPRTELHARLANASHRRLKVASARLGRSQQEIVSAAIDVYLDYIEDEVLKGCRCMRNARG